MYEIGLTYISIPHIFYVFFLIIIIIFFSSGKVRYLKYK